MLMFGKCSNSFLIIYFNSSVKTIFLLFNLETHNINHSGVVFLLSMIGKKAKACCKDFNNS